MFSPSKRYAKANIAIPEHPKLIRICEAIAISMVALVTVCLCAVGVLGWRVHNFYRETNVADDIQALKEKLRGRIDFLRGDFTLASGKKSDFYFNGKTTTLRPDALNYCARIFIDMMRPAKPERVGGLTLGADALIGAITAFSFDLGMPMEGFIVRKEPKTHGTGQWIEGPELKAGQRVAIVEDVVTTGGSALKAVDRVRESYPGVEIVGVYALVDRLDGGREVMEERGIKLYSVFTKDDLL